MSRAEKKVTPDIMCTKFTKRNDHKASTRGVWLAMCAHALKQQKTSLKNITYYIKQLETVIKNDKRRLSMQLIHNLCKTKLENLDIPQAMQKINWNPQNQNQINSLKDWIDRLDLTAKRGRKREADLLAPESPTSSKESIPPRTKKTKTLRLSKVNKPQSPSTDSASSNDNKSENTSDMELTISRTPTPSFDFLHTEETLPEVETKAEQTSPHKKLADIVTQINSKVFDPYEVYGFNDNKNRFAFFQNAKETNSTASEDADPQKNNPFI